MGNGQQLHNRPDVSLRRRQAGSVSQEPEQSSCHFHTSVTAATIAGTACVFFKNSFLIAFAVL
jgi:hypothetical protein